MASCYKVRRFWIPVAGIAVIAIAAGIALRLHHPRPAPPPPAPAAPAATDITLAGRIEPRTIVPVGAPIEGAIDAYYLDAGQPVYKDQLLGRIHNADLDSAADQAQLALDRAQTRVTTLNGQQLSAKLEASRAEADQTRAHADLDRLKKEYDRQKGLWDVGATPRLVFEKAEKDYKNAQESIEKDENGAKDATAHLKQLEADLESANSAVVEATKAVEKAKADLNRGEIHSPEDGIVIARKGAQGETVDASSKDLFEIGTDLTELKIVLNGDTSRIRAGQTASIHAPDLSPDEIAGTVKEVQGNQAVVEFTSPNPLAKLDLTAQVKIRY